MKPYGITWTWRFLKPGRLRYHLTEVPHKGSLTVWELSILTCTLLRLPADAETPAMCPRAHGLSCGRTAWLKGNFLSKRLVGRGQKLSVVLFG